MEDRKETSDYAVRALAVVLGAGVVHAILAFVLLALLQVGHPIAGQRVTVALCATVSALAELAFLYVRTQRSSPDHVARSLPWVSWTMPTASALLLSLVTIPAAGVGSALERAAVIAPVVASSGAVGLVTGTVLDRLLRVLAAAYPQNPDGEPLLAPAPPTLAFSYIRIMATAATASAMVATATVLMHPAQALARGGWLPLLTTVALFAFAILVPLAAATLGQSPGGDIRSIAQRLDAHGYGAAEAMFAPVVVTRADQAGALLEALEDLRAGLHDEMRVYQDALDRTRAADTQKANFLNAVSHELRTPLNAVGGFAQLLLEDTDPALSEAQREDVELIRDGGAQLLELINDILDMSMIESGELRLSFASTDVAELVRSVVKIHQPLVDESAIQFQAEVGPNLPPVVCDARRLRQILTNLVSNAIKFTERGNITLRVAHDPQRGHVVIRCIDTGVGIAAEDLIEVFEEYRQAGSVKRRSKGTGLGLAIARRIALHHGGTLRVESAPRGGSTFTLRLPLEPPTRTETIDITEEAARTRATRPPTSGPLDLAERPW